MRSALAQADDATALAGVIRDPVRFCRGLLRQDLWPLQEAILRAIGVEVDDPSAAQAERH